MPFSISDLAVALGISESEASALHCDTVCIEVLEA